METVAFYSYKGGVGRSLLLLNSARFLALTGRRVVALDLDFEAPGLHYKFNVEERIQTGAVRLLSRSLDDDLPTLDDVREACVEVPTARVEHGGLRLLAAGPAPKRAYWADLRRLDEQLRTNAEVGLLEAVVDLQARIEEAWNPDVLLIDARTGITGLGGIATMALSDRVVLVTTRAKESVDGVCAVRDSLLATPTLRLGERKLEVVVARVQGTEAMGNRELREVLGEYFELPHDSGDGGAERKIGGHDAPPRRRYRATEQSLLFKTLAWIRQMWPSDAAVADLAQRRLVEVERAWLELIETGAKVNVAIHPGDYWSTSQLRTGVRVEAPDGASRTADIVAEFDNGEPSMIVEYVEDEDHAKVAQWWARYACPRVVALLGPEQKRSLFHVDTRWEARASTRRDLPNPQDFQLFDDPTDLSIDQLLKAAHIDRYLDQLVAQWLGATTTGLHGSMFWRPALACKILDGLAAIEGEGGANVLGGLSHGYSARAQLVMSDDRQVQEGLCAPLCWRVAPQAFIEAAGKVFAFIRSPAFHGLRRLARFIGLDYDPDAHFRREAPKLVGPDDDIYPLHDVFAACELTYEWSDHPLEDPPSDRENVAAKLPYHGYLGSYTPATGHIVLMAPTIETVAETLGRAPRYVGSVALLHLSVLGLLHNGIDLDGHRWEGFSTGDPPPTTIVLAQFFVHRFLLELADTHLLDAFEALTDRQAPAYRAWRNMGHVSLEAARAWMIAMRRGTQDCAPIELALLQPDD